MNKSTQKRGAVSGALGTDAESLVRFGSDRTLTVDEQVPGILSREGMKVAKFSCSPGAAWLRVLAPLSKALILRPRRNCQHRLGGACTLSIKSPQQARSHDRLIFPMRPCSAVPALARRPGHTSHVGPQ